MFIKSKGSNALAVVFVTMLGAVAADAAGVASAGQLDAPTVKVSYRDLDLSRPADVRTLYGRLQHAAASVCGQVSTLELQRYMAWKRCYRSALDSAVLSVHSPELLALYGAADGASSKAGQG